MSKGSSEKTDAMRAQREARWTRQLDKPPTGIAPSAATGRAERARSASPPPRVDVDGRREPGEGEGRCKSCGRMKTLARGRIPSHQKGLQKQCPGSGKVPA